ncbi:MAG: CPBP family intramembrane glutamate endopeptidase, partial [Myxococcota bacterium]
YAEWDFNVWVPAGFHILMNAYWEVFSVSDSAVGPMGSNAIRLVVILLSIAATIVIARRAGRSLRVRGRGWLLQTR